VSWVFSGIAVWEVLLMEKSSVSIGTIGSSKARHLGDVMLAKHRLIGFAIGFGIVGVLLPGESEYGHSQQQN
jgi:hypothetical protein